jgi:hypothetical protein
LLDEDPMCQVVVSTVAFANRLNAKSLLDSLSLGFPNTVDQMWQEKGPVGKDPDSSVRGVVFYQPSDLLNAQRQLSGGFLLFHSVFDHNLIATRHANCSKCHIQVRASEEATTTDGSR